MFLVLPDDDTWNLDRVSRIRPEEDGVISIEVDSPEDRMVRRVVIHHMKNHKEARRIVQIIAYHIEAATRIVYLADLLPAPAAE